MCLNYETSPLWKYVKMQDHYVPRYVYRRAQQNYVALVWSEVFLVNFFGLFYRRLIVIMMERLFFMTFFHDALKCF